MRATYTVQLILFALITQMRDEDSQFSLVFLFRPSTAFDAIFSTTEIKIM